MEPRSLSKTDMTSSKLTTARLSSLFATLGMALLSFITVAQGAPKVGELAPNFSLRDQDGKSHSLTDFKGKIVVLEWLNHECPFVKKHYSAGNMQALQKTYKAKGVVWLSICSSAPGKQGHMTPEEAQESLSKFQAAPTALLLDPEGKVSRLYDVKRTPEMFIISEAGSLVYAGAIDDTPSTDPGDVKGAKNYIAKALDELLEGKPVSEPVTKAYGCSIKH